MKNAIVIPFNTLNTVIETSQIPNQVNIFNDGIEHQSSELENLHSTQSGDLNSIVSATVSLIQLEVTLNYNIFSSYSIYIQILKLGKCPKHVILPLSYTFMYQKHIMIYESGQIPIHMLSLLCVCINSLVLLANRNICFPLGSLVCASMIHNKHNLETLDYPLVSYFWQFIKTIAWNCQGLGNYNKPEI